MALTSEDVMRITNEVTGGKTDHPGDNLEQSNFRNAVANDIADLREQHGDKENFVIASPVEVPSMQTRNTGATLGRSVKRWNDATR